MKTLMKKNRFRNI